MTVTADTLNDVMEIDHVVLVTAYGHVSDVDDIYAPDTYIDVDEAGYIVPGGIEALRDSLAAQGWEPVGRSGQQGGGWLMHASEYIGGGLAELILSEPGTYVACVVDCLGETDSTEFEEPAGWIVARKI